MLCGSKQLITGRNDTKSGCEGDNSISSIKTKKISPESKT